MDFLNKLQNRVEEIKEAKGGPPDGVPGCSA